MAPLPEKININLIPKEFVDGGACGHFKEGFSFVMMSGQASVGFFTTPTQFKKIAEMYINQVDEYEKKYGKIIDNAPKEIISPIQFLGIGDGK